MNDWARNTALANARATLSSTHELVRVIRSAGTEVGELSIAPRQAKELSRFLDAHRQAVQALLERAESVAGADELSMQGLVARQADLERAHSFVQSAFIDPRRSKEERQSLEAADWMCVEGFLRFVEPENGPIGPLVAVDPMRSPAVWDPGTSLPLPSLFRKQPEKLDREANPEESDRVLDYFPVVCLPSNLARSPEFYPLLSHEVGHAVDSTLGWSGEILRKLSASKLRDFWQSWMREMLADFVGLAVSGEAFALALHGYVRYMGVTREITAASSYPGIELRLAMLRDAIAKYDRGDCPVARLLDDRLNKAGEFSKEGKKLRTAYLKDVLPVLEQTLKFTPEAWQNEQTQTEELAGKLGRGAADTKADLPTRPLPFPLYSSAVALAKLESEQLDSLDVFRRLHTHAADLHRPDWVQSPSVWEFSVKTIPTLRPTLLASDGETKVPPKELLVY
ncbi:MAG: hypothetical protein EHM42_06730, partial [Planctomycetaceae bacterium]